MDSISETEAKTGSLEGIERETALLTGLEEINPSFIRKRKYALRVDNFRFMLRDVIPSSTSDASHDLIMLYEMSVSAEIP
jgi:hypothetical protein